MRALIWLLPAVASIALAWRLQDNSIYVFGFGYFCAVFAERAWDRICPSGLHFTLWAIARAIRDGTGTHSGTDLAGGAILAIRSHRTIALGSRCLRPRHR